MSGVPATGKRDYVRMVKHDLLKTDLVMLRDILENMAAMHKTLFNSTHLLAWTL